MKLQLLLLLFCLVQFLDAACDKAYEIGVSKKEQDQVVKAHNKYRLMVANKQVPDQPRGINLKRMKWDDKLAQAAQNIANSCEFAHKPVTDGRWQVGQNIYMSTYPSYHNGSDWDGAVKSWYDEHEVYTYPNGFAMNTGHYTQIRFEYVGCGYTSFPNGKKNQKLYVCNYGPSGNWKGQAPYKTGKSGCEKLC